MNTRTTRVPQAPSPVLEKGGARMNSTGVKIMIVDNNKEFLEELKEVLSYCGYETTAVDDPMLALEEAIKTKPDIIILDLKMPKKNGFQLAADLRHSPEICHIPIFAMTGYYKDDLINLMEWHGIIKCLKKPFTPAEIVRQIADTL